MFPIVPAHTAATSASGGGQRSRNGASAGKDHRPERVWNVWSGTVGPPAAPTTSKKRTKPHPLHQRRLRDNSDGGASDSSTLPGGCHQSGGFSATQLPPDSRSHSFESIDAAFAVSGRIFSPRITVTGKGYLECAGEPQVAEAVWMRQLRLSMDVHSNNVTVEMVSYELRKSLRVRVLRPIEAGEELLLWFSEEIVALMGIPFLTPANIRGEKDIFYVFYYQ